MTTPVIPVTDETFEQTHTRLTIRPSFKASDGSEYAFDGTGYHRIVEPWAVEGHVGPIKVQEQFGDIESWGAYVARYGVGDRLLLTWSAGGLKAVLDYHMNEDEPGRCAWQASHPFQTTRQWEIWKKLCQGSLSQKALVEALEDNRLDISTPPMADLVGMIRKLRATADMAAESELGPNGETLMTFVKTTKTSLQLPESITINIPVLKGHTALDGNGRPGPVHYTIDVRIRVDVLTDGPIARAAFRLSMPTAEQVLEAAVLDRVETARGLLPAGFDLLRAV